MAIPCILVGPAGAREVGFPQVHPKVAMDVPDDWAVAYTAFGLELKSPEDNLYIVADILPRKKDEADAWAKKATAKMEAFGVTFGAPKPPELAKPAPTTAIVQPPPVSATPVEPAKIEATKIEPDKPVQVTAEPTKPEPIKPDAPVTSNSPKPDAMVKADIAAPVPAPMPSTVDGAKAVQAKAEPLKVEASKVDPAKVDPAKVANVEVAKPEPTKSEVIASAPTPQPIVLDRAAPAFTFMNPPVPINPPAAAAPEAIDRVPVFSGPPSIEAPERSKAETALKSDIPEGGTLDELTRPTPTLPKLLFKVGRFPPATWNNQPVDVQIVNFGLSTKQLFLVVQASLSTDDRAVAVISSAHLVK